MDLDILNNQIIIYSLSVTGILFTTLLLTNFVITRIEKGKIRLLGKRKNLESVPIDEPPIEDSFIESMTRGLENIETRFNFFRRIINPFIVSLWLILIVFPHLGGESRFSTSIVLTAITVIISIAAKPYIENLFAGLVISFSNTVRIGDTIEMDGHFGTIEEINLTYTTVKVWDWRRYLVPNAKLINKEFVNFSLYDKVLWSYVEFYVEPSTDIDKLEKLLVADIKKSPYFDQREYEDPQIWFIDVNKDSLKLWVASWVNSPTKAWMMRSDMRKSVQRCMNELGYKFHMTETQAHLNKK